MFTTFVFYGEGLCCRKDVVSKINCHSKVAEMALSNGSLIIKIVGNWGVKVTHAELAGYSLWVSQKDCKGGTCTCLSPSKNPKIFLQ